MVNLLLVHGHAVTAVVVDVVVVRVVVAGVVIFKAPAAEREEVVVGVVVGGPIVVVDRFLRIVIVDHEVFRYFINLRHVAPHSVFVEGPKWLSVPRVESSVVLSLRRAKRGEPNELSGIIILLFNSGSILVFLKASRSLTSRTMLKTKLDSSLLPPPRPSLKFIPARGPLKQMLLVMVESWLCAWK